MSNTYEEMVTKNMGLVRHVSKHYRGRADYEDILQCGYYGLCEAARRFDPSRGTSFATFACSYIKGRIQRYYREFAISPLKLPRSKINAICCGEQENVPFVRDGDGEESYFNQISDVYNLEEQCIAKIELSEAIQYIKQNFSDFKVAVYFAYFFGNKVQSEIAKSAHISQSRVSHIIQEINSNIKNRFIK